MNAPSKLHRQPNPYALTFAGLTVETLADWLRTQPDELTSQSETAKLVMISEPADHPPQADGWRHDGRYDYRGFVISYDPPPIPIRTMDWHYTHENYDGAPDAYDDRHGHCASLEECKAEIDREFFVDGEEEEAA